jgi:uncharacterized lipoprotein YmbA
VKTIHACGLLLLAAIAGCGSAPMVRYHSLLGAAGATPPAGAALSWQLGAVTVPAQLDQPQWLVRLPDESLRLLEQERWAGPLADELRAGLNEGITRRLGMPGLAKPASGHHWRVRVELQRLELAPSRQAALVVDWRVGAGAAMPELQCRDVQQKTVPPGFDALAAAQRDAVALLGERIAAALAALDRGAVVACPG